jgi:hypothetical protein
MEIAVLGDSLVRRLNAERREKAMLLRLIILSQQIKQNKPQVYWLWYVECVCQQQSSLDLFFMDYEADWLWKLYII